MSTTLAHGGPAAVQPAWLAAVLRRFASIGSAAAASTETAQQLLDRADAYESTQPGYAADLRSAAQRMLDAG